MRFYFGLSKRISLKNLFKIALMLIGGLLAFFGINNITVLALEDGFTNRSIGNIKYCSYNTTSPNATCTASSSTYENATINGIANTMVPTGIETSQNGRMTPSSRTIYWIYSGVSASGADNPCNNPNTISFNVTINLEDPNNVLASNELNPNTYNGPTPVITASLREAIFGFTRKSYSSSSSYYQYLLQNNVGGVKAGFRYGTGTNDYRNESNCGFVSYGSNKSLNYRCTLNATLPSNSLYIRVGYTNDSYINHSSNYSNLIIRDDIKVSEINDPCNNNYTSDSQGVIDSINGQSGQIAQNTQDIIDSQNNINDNITDFKNNNHQDMEDLKDKADALEGALDDTNDKLDDIKDSIDNFNDNTNCSIISSNDFPNKNTYVNVSSGDLTSYNGYNSTNFIKYTDGIKIYASWGSAPQANICFYNQNKTKLSCYHLKDYGTTNNYYNLDNIPHNSYTYYIRVSMFTSSNIGSDINTKYYLKTCSGIGQTISDYMNDEGIDDSFVPEGIRDITDLIDNEPEIIQDLIQLPVKFLRTVYDNVSSDSCSAYTIDVPFFDGHTYHWSFTCPNYNELIGETPTTILDAIICFILIFGIAKMGVRVYEDISSAKDTFDEIYKGGH